MIMDHVSDLCTSLRVDTVIGTFCVAFPEEGGRVCKSVEVFADIIASGCWKKVDRLLEMSHQDCQFSW